MTEIKTDTDTMLHVGTAESTGIDREQYVCIMLTDESQDETQEMLTYVTAGQAKELIKILQRKVANIEQNK